MTCGRAERCEHDLVRSAADHGERRCRCRLPAGAGPHRPAARQFGRWWPSARVRPVHTAPPGPRRFGRPGCSSADCMVGGSPVATASRNAKSADHGVRPPRAASARVRRACDRAWRASPRAGGSIRACTAPRIEANVSTIVTPWASAIRETIKMSSRFLKLVNFGRSNPTVTMHSRSATFARLCDGLHGFCGAAGDFVPLRRSRSRLSDASGGPVGGRGGRRRAGGRAAQAPARPEGHHGPAQPRVRAGRAGGADRHRGRLPQQRPGAPPGLLVFGRQDLPARALRRPRARAGGLQPRRAW